MKILFAASEAVPFIKTGGLAGLFIHVGKGRVVGVNAVYVALFGKGGHGGQQRSQQCADKKFFHAHFPPRKKTEQQTAALNAYASAGPRQNKNFL